MNVAFEGKIEREREKERERPTLARPDKHESESKYVQIVEACSYKHAHTRRLRGGFQSR